MKICPVTSTSDVQAVTATAAKFSPTMAAGQFWSFVCSVAAYISQAAAALLSVAELDLDTPSAALDTIVKARAGGAGGNSITVAAAADSAAAEGVTIAEVGNAVTIHFEDGVSTVADVEAAIDADSTLIMVKTAGTGATVLAGADAFAATALAGGGALSAPIATAADGSMYVPANTPVLIDGAGGDSLSVIRAAGDGTASLTRMRIS